MQGVFSTYDVERSARAAYWSDLVCDIFVRLDCRFSSARSFNATMRYGSLSWLRVAGAESDAIEGVRSRRQISKGYEDDFLVSIQTKGKTLVCQDGREALLGPGDFALYDSERPYRLEMSEGTQIVCLQFPRAQLISRLGATKAYVAQAIHGQSGIRDIFLQLARSLPQRLSEINACEAQVVADYALDLLALSLSRGVEAAPALSSSKTVTLERLKRVIRSRLRDPALDPSDAATHAGVSKRHANRLLALEGTSLERFIFSERLERCRAALRDQTLDHRTISEIAFGWGFNDCGHFSRSFRARFGTSPSEFRKSAHKFADR